LTHCTKSSGSEGVCPLVSDMLCLGAHLGDRFESIKSI